MKLSAFADSGRRCLRPCLLLALVAALSAGTSASAATITVDTTVDDDLADGECSLREAILAANTDAPRNDCPAGNGPDRIVFTLAKGETIALGGSLPTITDTLLVRGPGAELLAIDGQNLHQIFSFDPAAFGRWLGVEELTLTQSFAPTGGAVQLPSGQGGLLRRVILRANRASSGGGALHVTGTSAFASRVEVIECWFDLNQSLGALGGGGIRVVDEGVDFSVDRTTFSGNLASGSNGNGGALMVSRATASIQRSTFSANQASDYGGAIATLISSTPTALAIRDSTITGNRANSDDNSTGSGGGIGAILSTLEPLELGLANSIVAGNLDGVSSPSPDIYLPSSGLLLLTTSGFNLIGSNEGAESVFVAGAPNPEGDYVGTAAAPIDPQLNPLADYGGFAPDHRPAIVAGTPVIDKGFCSGSPADQRGYGDAVNHLRIVDTAFANGPGSDGCDIGSHERAGDPGADPAIFSDGFERGHTLDWSTELL
ncbi:MAG: CSLREA domain-containing protein [Thermoanaerobaculia bacterium]